MAETKQDPVQEATQALAEVAAVLSDPIEALADAAVSAIKDEAAHEAQLAPTEAGLAALLADDGASGAPTILDGQPDDVFQTATDPTMEPDTWGQPGHEAHDGGAHNMADLQAILHGGGEHS